MNKKKLFLVSGFALFSMFFGAGNLIFPPTLGSWVGDNYVSSTIGFSLTGVGLVMLGVIATTKAGGQLEDVSSKLGSKFALLFGTLILLSIGPGLAIPRTAATTHELIQASLIENLSPLLSAVIFFGIVLFFVLRPANIIDDLGKILTPALLLLLLVLIFKGIAAPIALPVATDFENTFSKSFEEGYQTMDALASLAFTAIIIKGFELKGLTDRKEIFSLTVKSGAIAAIGLCIVYGGLLYLGASISGIDLGEISRVERLIYIADNLLGYTGALIMAGIMILACLTTAIGLTSAFSDFFSRMTNNKIPYNVWAIISAVFSGYMALGGVESIVKISVPVLLAMYPVTIVLIFLNLFSDTFKKRATYMGGVLGALLPTIFKILGALGLPVGFVDSFNELFPEAIRSFVWVIPTVVLAVIFTMTLGRNEKVTE
ncbi:branched-chain amino acid transport system II carrier protein [Peptoniphilus catoniae]|uniref:branched-chain amino acid transport system II carrier protein n=1 Tax=Peptoniphilus catoniae TaxID=1660341 RepID=UPI0010FF3D27|nr:branched-chain amino acid transport system II carrier protein [Peptoniphilus catoniae]